MITTYYQTDLHFDIDLLVSEMRNLNGSLEISVEHKKECILICAERYFMRNNSSASCTLLFTRQEMGYDLIVISSGAGGGLLNIDYGASKKYAENVSELVKKQGAIEIRKEG